MATITNIRIYTQSKAVPNAGYIAIDKVMMEGNTIVAMGGDVRYVLGVVPMENIVVDTPSAPEECGCNTTNANIFATLIKGVDGITPDMSDYYDKGQVDNKLSTKQDVISDIDNIRRNALKGATALQQSNVDGELSLGSRNPVQNATVTEAVSQISEIVGLMYNIIGGLEETVANKQDTIADLTTIRDGAAKGATALQSSDVDSEVSETSTNPVQNKAVAGALIEIVGALDATLSNVGERFNSKQDKLVSGENIKTINGESIIGEGDITIGGGGGGDLSGYATEEYVNNAVEEVNVKGEDGYVYSNGEKVDMRFTRSLIPVGTSIPANANLNTVAYLKVGKYYCSQNADAKTITNCPTTSAFSMEVFNPLSPVVDNETTAPYVYRIRILTVYNTGVQYVQYATVGSTVNKWTYNSWYVIPRSPFTLNSNKKGGSAALGSATQGVYINSEGTFTKMSYTLGKSVPSSAVFTDTNTKVTAVGNHYTPVEDESVVIEAPDGEVVIGLKRDAAGHVVGVMSTPMSGGGSGGGGITKESDPVFSASPAATITEKKMAEWDNKVPYASKDFLIVGADGFMTSDGDGFVFPGTPASQDGQGFVLATLEDIPNALTESDIAAMGFTKNEGTITEVKMNGVSKGTTGVVDLGDVPTQESVGNLQDHVEDLWSEVGKLTQDKQDALKSGENIKTINGESILGSGNITISGGGGASGSAQLPANYISSNIAQGCIIPSGMVTIFSIPQTEGVTMRLSTADMESGKDSAWVIRFSIGADNTGSYVVEPEDNFSLKWANGIAPTFENGKYYEMSFRLIGTMFLGVWASFE